MKKLHKWFAEGIRIPFGSGNTPIDMGWWRRIDPRTNMEKLLHFLPYHGIPTTLGPQRPREASPTGKSGMGIATYSIAWQPIASARSSVIMTVPNMREGKLTTTGVVDPQLSQIQSIYQPQNGGPKFSA